VHNEEKFAVAAIVTVVLIAVFAIFLPPYMEMKTFNKFKSESQPSATYWDAVCSELRVNSD